MTERGEIDGWMAEALRLHQAGAPAQAVVLYRQVVAARPEEAEALHLLGIALHQTGARGEALDLIRESIARQPRRVDWLNHLGNVFTELKRHDEAAEAFARALEIEPGNDGLLANLGSVRQRQKRHAEAEELYRRAVAANPGNAEAYNLLASLMNEQDRRLESARFHALALIAGPDAGKSPFELGKAYLILDRVEEAAEVYRQWLARSPGDPTAAHLHAACSRLNVSERCSEAYVEATFDSYASAFDEKLGALSYRGPELVGEMLRRLLPAGAALEVLDACCGTGLCGPVLKPFARRLTGVDLSRGMLERAGKRGLYDELVKAELGAYLEGAPGRFDLISCADALIYFGRLDALFVALASGLKPGGFFLFTIEAAPDAPEDYVLNPTGRYCHSGDYVAEVAGAAGLAILEMRKERLRIELDRPVEGWVAVARKAG